MGGYVFDGDGLVMQAPGLPVWGGLGVAAVGGDRRAQALVAEFVRESCGQRRVGSWSELSKRFGSPPARPRRSVGSGAHCWVSSGVAGAVELSPHKQRRDVLAEGMRLVSAGDVGSAAVLWSAVCGRRVVVGSSDGVPLLRFENECVDEGGRLVSDVAVLGSLNGSEEPQESVDRKARMLGVLLSKFEADEAELVSALESAQADGRGAEVKGARERVKWFHDQIRQSPDGDLRSRWVELLMARFEASDGVDGFVFDWITELEGWQ
jgi:hypothetical protein